MKPIDCRSSVASYRHGVADHALIIALSRGSDDEISIKRRASECARWFDGGWHRKLVRTLLAGGAL